MNEKWLQFKKKMDGKTFSVSIILSFSSQIIIITYISKLK